MKIYIGDRELEPIEAHGFFRCGFCGFESDNGSDVDVHECPADPGEPNDPPEE